MILQASLFITCLFKELRKAKSYFSWLVHDGILMIGEWMTLLGSISPNNRGFLLKRVFSLKDYLFPHHVIRKPQQKLQSQPAPPPKKNKKNSIFCFCSLLQSDFLVPSHPLCGIVDGYWSLGIKLCDKKTVEILGKISWLETYLYIESMWRKVYLPLQGN